MTKLKTKTIDITKTGPLGYRTLERLNQDLNGIDPKIASFISNTRAERASNTLFDPKVNATLYTKTSLANTSRPWGDSWFDDDTATDTLALDLNDIRANNTPWYANVGASLAKAAVKAGTTFLDGTAGLVVGIGDAIKRSFEGLSFTDSISALWNNPISESMNDINEFAEKNITNNYTDAVNNRPWYENLGSSKFWGEDVIKNAGFTIGAIYSGGLATKGLKALGLTSKMALTGVGTATSALNEGRVEALTNSKLYLLTNSTILADKHNKRLNQLHTLYGNTNLYYKEANAENVRYAKSVDMLKESANKMGNVDLLLNMPILMAGNLIQYGKLFGRGFTTASAIEKETARNAMGLNVKGTIKEALEGGKDFVKGTTKKGAALAFTKNALSEGVEEVNQLLASNISGDKYLNDVMNFYKRGEDPNSKNTLNEWWKATSKAFGETMGASDTWELFVVGAMMGAAGVPMFRSIHSKEGNLQSPITIGGGAVEAVQDYFAKRDMELNIVDRLNERVHSPEFVNYYKGLTRHISYDDSMNKAALKGDAYNYKNSEHLQLVSDIIMFDKAGKLGDFKKFISDNQSLTPEEQKAQDENLNLSEEDKQLAKLDLKKNTDKVLKTIDNYTKTKDKINKATGYQLNDDNLNELTLIKSLLNNWEARASDIVSSIKDKFETTRNHLNDNISYYRLLLKGKDSNSKEYKDIQDKIDEELKLVDTIDKITLLPKHRLTNKKDIADITKDTREIADKHIKNEADKSVINTNLNDLNRIAEEHEIYDNKLNTYLNAPRILQEAMAKALLLTDKANQLNETLNLVEVLANTSTPDLVSLAENGDIDLDALDSLLEEFEAPEEVKSAAKAKVENVKKIVDTKQLTIKRIDESDADDDIKDIAKEMIENSSKLSLSPDELLDTDNEAFLDSDALIGLNDFLKEEYQRMGELGANALELSDFVLGIKEDKIDQARLLVGVTRDELKAALDEMSSLRTEDAKPVKTFNNDSDTPNSTPNTPSNDSTNNPNNPNTNTPNANALALPQNNEALELPLELPKTKETGRDKIEKLEPVNTSNPALVNTSNNTQSKETKSNHIATHTVETSEDLEHLEKTENENNTTYGSSKKTYWKSNTTEYSIHDKIGENSHWYDKATSSLKSLYKKVWDYLNNNNVFKRRNSNFLKKGDTCYIAIDKKFMQDNQVLVPLIVTKDSEGNYLIVGDLMSNKEWNTSIFKSYPNMLKFIEGAYADYTKLNNTSTQGNLVIMNNYTLTVADNLIGHPLYTNIKEQHSLNDIANGLKFKLGIALDYENKKKKILVDSKKVNANSTTVELSVLTPLNYKPGQPFLLIETSNSKYKYITVPILMDSFNTKDLSILALKVNLIALLLNDMVNLILHDMPTLLSIKDQLLDLLGFDYLYFGIDKNGNPYINYETSKEDSLPITLSFSSDYNSIGESFLSNLSNSKINYLIREDKINDDKELVEVGDKKVTYNEAIGEVAHTNLAIGALHTVNDFPVFDYKNENMENVEAVLPLSKLSKQLAKLNISNNSEYSYYKVKGLTIAYNKNTGRFYNQKNIDITDTLDNNTKSSIWCKENNIYDASVKTPYCNDNLTYNVFEGKIYTNNRSIEIQTKIDNANNVISDILIKNNPDNIEHPTLSNNTYTIHGKKYLRVHTIMGDNWIGEKSDKAIKNGNRAKIAGTEIDKIVRCFFNNEPYLINTNIISQEALNQLLDYLLTLKDYFDKNGETVYANNLVLGHDFNGLKIAGELDILTVDKDGNFRIYDMKTSKNDFNGPFFNNDSKNTIKSTKKVYEELLNFYSEMLKKEYGITPVELKIIPMLIKFDTIDATESTLPVTGISGKHLINLESNPTVVYDKINKYNESKQGNNNGNTKSNPKEGEHSNIDDSLEDSKNTNQDKSTFRLNTLRTLLHNSIVKDTPLYYNIVSALNEDLLLKLANMKNARILQLLNKIKSNISDYTSVNTTEVLNAFDANYKARAKHSEVKDTNRQVWNKNLELRKLARMLPLLSKEQRIKIVDSIDNVTNADDPIKAWGLFLNGVITIYDKAPRGVLYHEAFHYVFNGLYNNNLRETAYKLAKEQYGDLTNDELEEKMAEGFREYVLFKEDATLGSKIKSFFRDLLDSIKSFFTGRDSLNSIYRSIYNGKLADKQYNLEDDINAKYMEANKAVYEVNELNIRYIQLTLSERGIIRIMNTFNSNHHLYIDTKKEVAKLNEYIKKNINNGVAMPMFAILNRHIILLDVNTIINRQKKTVIANNKRNTTHRSIKVAFNRLDSDVLVNLMGNNITENQYNRMNTTLLEEAVKCQG